MQKVKELPLAVVTLFLVATSAQAATVEKFIDQPYEKLRVALLKEGWEPAPREADDDCNMTSANLCSVYPEAKYCAGTGVSPCVLGWTKGAKKLFVGTVGEAPSVVSGYKNRWTDDWLTE